MVKFYPHFDMHHVFVAQKLRKLHIFSWNLKMSINKRYDFWGHRYARSLNHEIEMNEVHTATDSFTLVKYSLQ